MLEIKNLAVHLDFWRQGIDCAMIDEVATHASGVYHTLQVGTSDSPATMPFYECCGFVRHHIIEKGVQLVDMVVLRRRI